MDDREQQLRERAYRIWEDEGRVEGFHEDHWKRAEQQDKLGQQQSEDLTKVNKQADAEFADDREPDSATEIRPPSSISPD